MLVSISERIPNLVMFDRGIAYFLLEDGIKPQYSHAI